MTRLLALVFCVFCLACLGCGSDAKLGEVSGTVTMDGKPLANAIVAFTPTASGRGSSGTTDDKGQYTLGYIDRPGALIGEHKVSVRLASTAEVDPSLDESSDSEAYMKQAMGGDQSAYDKAETKETIPAKYNTETTLKFEVKKGSNTYDIKIDSK